MPIAVSRAELRPGGAIQTGLYVDGGGPAAIDTVMGMERLAGVAAADGVRKKVVVVVSTAGVGEFPDGSKGFNKEVSARLAPAFQTCSDLWERF
jgi:hypothetical protein